MATILQPRQSEGPVNVGEARLLDYLKKTLPADYILIPNVELPYRNQYNNAAESLEFDCLVVAPHAVYHLEAKDWRGRVSGDDQNWFINGQLRRNPFPGANRKSKILASKLKEVDPTWGAAWIATAVVIVDAATVLDLGGDSAVYKLNRELVEYLQDPGQARSFPDKIVRLQSDIATWIAGRSQPATAAPRVFEAQYEIEEIEDQRDAYTEFIVRPKGGHSQARKRVREFALEVAGLDATERKNRLDRILNQYNAVQRIGVHPYILQCQIQTDVERGYLYEISDYMEEQSLQSLLTNKTFTLREKIEIVRNVAQALRAAHNAGVIHRDVSPENIYWVNGFAMLGNFGRSFFTLGTGLREYTAMPTLQDNDLTPYIPLELKNQDPNFRTDLYALGVTAYQLLLGRPAILDCHELDRLGGKLPDERLPTTLDPTIPRWLDDFMLQTIRLEPEDRFESADQVLDFFELHEKAATLPSPPPSPGVAPDEPGSDTEIRQGMREGIYLYVERLGKGGYSEVWRVRHSLQSREFAIKIYQPSVNVESVISEYDALKELEHPNIVRFEWNDRSVLTGRYYTLMEMLDGETLEVYASSHKSQQLPMAEVYRAAVELLNALIYLHGRPQPILHRDIKPNNIVWEPQKPRFVLIDFNVAAVAENDKQNVGTTPYQAPDRIVNGRTVDWDASCDTFALGVTLYELVCKAHPYPSRLPAEQRQPTDPRFYRRELSEPFAAWLLRAVQPRRDERFAFAQEMLDGLHAIGLANLFERTSLPETTAGAATETAPELSAEAFVRQLNRLFSQSRHGNAGTRGLDDFARSTYIPTKLDEHLKETILHGAYRLVIITGNAGDGKTAFIQKVERQAQELYPDAFETLSSGNGARFVISHVPFESNYDGSQNERGKNNDAVLDAFFAPFAGVSAFAEAPEGRIIAINEGRLAEYLELHRHRYALLARTVDDFFNSDYTSTLPDGILLVNLNVRSVVSTESGKGSIFQRQLAVFLAPRHWESCASCAAADRCFIRYNVASLSDPSLGNEAQRRMEELLRTVTLRRELHITMRDLRSLLAFWLTRDHTCEEARALAEQGEPVQLLEKLYFNLTDHDSTDRGQQDRFISLLRRTDVAFHALPADDRALHYKTLARTDFLPASERSLPVLEWFDRLKRQSRNEAADGAPEALQGVHRILRRLHYFEGNTTQYSLRNPYRSVLNFLSFFEPLETGREAEHAQKRQALMEQIARAIGLLEGCKNVHIINRNIVLAAGQRDPFCASFRVFPLEEFEIREDRRPALGQYIEYVPDKLLFYHREQPDISLVISLDIYEMLWHIEKGYLPSLTELKGGFIELSVFKNKLANRSYRSVLVTQDNETFFEISADPRNHIHVQRLTTAS